MTRLQKLLALLISLSMAIMVVFYGRYILKPLKPNTFLSYQYPEPVEKDSRTDDIIHEPVKQDGRTGDVVHEPLTHNGRTYDIIHNSVKQDGRTDDTIREPLKHNGRPRDFIRDSVKQDGRTNDIIHEPVKHDGRTNDVIHEPAKLDARTHYDLHEPLKKDGRTNDVLHTPARHDSRTNDIIYDPVKHGGRTNDVIHKPQLDNDRTNGAMPVKHDGWSNNITHEPETHDHITNDVKHEPVKHVGRTNDVIYDPVKQDGRTNAQITFRRSSLGESVQSMTPSVVPMARSVVPTLPTACTYSGRNVVKVNTTGHFLHRLQMYNDAIGRLRREILAARPLVSPWKPIGANLAVLWGNRDDFLQCLTLRDEVITMTLPWQPSDRTRKWRSRRDRRNVLVQDYYEWTATEPLCSWIGQRGFTKARWDAVYNQTCVTDTTRSIAPTSLEPVYFHGKPINVRDYWPNSGDAYPACFYTRPPEHVFYAHLVRDAVITDLGDIISGSLKFLPYSCSQDTTDAPPRGYEKTVVYGEVFIMTQFWGGAHFHKMLEGFPRLAPYLAFLRANERVLIHAAETTGYTAATLHFLGINPERLVTGLCRAKVVYMPQSTPCGFAHAQSTQLLSKLYRDRIRHRKATRNGLVLVQRSGTRRFTRAGAIHAALLSVANETGLVFELYPDQPPPSMETSMRTFAGAAVVVAPHGAGLSNLVYAEPGTYVVEAVCNPPHVNMCYQWVAHVLGMRYHALPSRRGCEAVIDVDVDVVADVVRTYARRAAAELRMRMRGNS